MNIFQRWTEILQDLACEIFSLSENNDSIKRITVEVPREQNHGHLSTNMAMVLAKTVELKPLEAAKAICLKLKEIPDVDSAEPAGPGFINITLGIKYWNNVLAHILKNPLTFGRSNIGQGFTANIEYVSCNPTGPMHIGHSRGAIIGDVLANLYKALGYEVVKEFYCNDAGSQVQALARSLYKRYCEQLGFSYDEEVEYPGEYLQPIASTIISQDGDKWIGKDEAVWLEYFQAFAIESIMKVIRQDLAKLGIFHDVFTSEKSLIERGIVEDTVDMMQSMGLLYHGVLPKPKGHDDEDWEPREQLLFRSTDFGDDTDRALRKSDGSYTYFTSDVAYHRDKIERGAHLLINIWGADHAGYIKRIQAAVKAISRGRHDLKVVICQLIKFMKNGEAVKMSKRAGTFITVDDVLSEVGKDVVRFVILTRRNDAPLDFDFTKVVEQSRDNPVFYVHYAHARICSVLRHAAELFPEHSLDLEQKMDDYDSLYDEEDYALIRLLSLWPRTVELAALACEPHRIAFYLYDLASAFHSLWTKGKDDIDLRFIHADNWKKTQPRLKLLKAIQAVFAAGFEIIGVEPVEELH